MKSHAEYSADAERIRMLADNTTGQGHRETYLQIASDYDDLAEDARVMERERSRR
jgi:hypothetical protein